MSVKGIGFSSNNNFVNSIKSSNNNTSCDFNVNEVDFDPNEFSLDEVVSETNNIPNFFDVQASINDFFSIFDSNPSALPITFRKALEKGLDVTDLPHYNEDKYRFRFQGYTVTDKYIYVTACDHEKKEASILMIYDKNGNYYGRVSLPKGLEQSHVGGISYDSVNNVIFITGEEWGSVFALDNNVLEKAIKDSHKSDRIFHLDLNKDLENYKKDKLILDSDFNINDYYANELADYYIKTMGDACPYSKEALIVMIKQMDLKAASTYYDGKTKKLYIPTFSGDTNILVFDVSYDKRGRISYKLDTIYGLGIDNSGPINSTNNLPYGVQGVATHHDALGRTYIVMASSYGKCDSVLTKYQIMPDGSLKFAGEKVLKGERGIENMTIDAYGNVVCNYENFSAGTEGDKYYKINILNISDPIDDPKYVEIMDKLKQIIKDNKYDSNSNYKYKENDSEGNLKEVI